MDTGIMIHPHADVQSRQVGRGTHIWQYVVVLEGARIGEDCNICAHCFLEGDVIIGDRVTLKSGVQLWNGLRIEDDVFVGPNATFANDKFPRSKAPPAEFLQTRIERGASIGAGAVILPDITIGQGAMIGAGAVVTKSVPPFAIVVGSPARIVGYVENRGHDEQSAATSIQPTVSASDSVTYIGVGDVTFHRFKLVADMRGDLSVGEFERNIPFTPKRYFLVFNVPSQKTRGEHAHRACHQFLICVKGSCAVVADDGYHRAEVLLDSPDKGVYLPPMVWGVQYKYSEDAVLLVFTSDYYDASDYIRDYAQFIELVRTQGTT